MPHKIDPDTLGFLIADVSRLMRGEFDRRAAETGLGITPGEARTLSHVARAGTTRQAALAERMGIEAMTLSASLDRLEAQGLVARTPDPTDGRAKLVRITENAEALLAEIGHMAAGLRNDMTASMAPDEVDAVIAALKLLRSNLTSMRPGCTARGRPAA